MTTTAAFGCDRSIAPAAFTDRDLVAEFMREDGELGYGVPDYERHAALDAEIKRRFGADATENTAEKSVAWHMSHEDLVRWPLESWDDCRKWLTGEINMTNYEEHYSR